MLRLKGYTNPGQAAPVSGCGDIVIDEEKEVFTLGGEEFHKGDYISLDGTTGKIYKGDIKTVEATVSGNFGRIMAWADEYRKLGVRTNADTPSRILRML